MAYQVQVMPARCTRCGVLFDLSYELGENDLPEERELRFSGKAARKNLCWNCRV